MKNTLIVIGLVASCSPSTLSVDSRELNTEAACVTPESGIEVVRTGASEYQVCVRGAAGPLRYVLSGDRNPKPPHQAAYGDGQIRLIELWWTGGEAYITEWQLLSCGNCDAITAVRSPGETSWAWTGGGYGRESDRAGVTVLIDGVERVLGIGQSIDGNLLDVRQTLTAFTATGQPVLQRHVKQTITAARWMWTADDLAIDDHELGDIYAGRLEGVSACTGGLWTGYRSADGNAWAMPHCNAGPPNIYTYPTGEWTELYGSSLVPRLRVTLPQSTGWRAIANMAYDSKLKLYGFTGGYSNPQMLSRGDKRHYEFKVEVMM
jgi:hypothetical protein